MELLIIIGGIAAVVFIFNIFFKYQEGRAAVSKLTHTCYEHYKLKQEHQKLTKEVESKKQRIAELESVVEEKNKLRQEQRELTKENESNKQRIAELECAVEEKDDLYKSLANTEGFLFSNLSSLMSDFRTIQYDISAKYLLTKKHPAHKEAQRIDELKRQTKQVIERSKMSQYKYEYLFTLFPDLELYVDSAEELDELTQFSDLNDLQINSDYTKKYLTKEEYKALPEEERNQLALNRYIENQKSKWEIGRDYELYIGYVYACEGWDVEYFGIEQQLNDMGRDLIARKDGVVHIIQCKYWSQKKLIHEKHIAQLYGTTVQYKLSGARDEKVVPVFVTNIKLSNTALKFADYLDVKYIENRDFKEFPRIKCNVNRDEFGETKIYHLPMDQQYDRTKISNKGDCFSYTVKEAMSKGFRRAYRWYGNG